ncbi:MULTISPECIES: flotillin family protein [Enterococcus]|uniref:Flotillin n=1 Tax=Enterococcus thailandicus TaxID=417368 RepID=A0A179EW93_ENTTH|nr:flotillin family protein [Enterococcus thailandicus]MDK4350792.1 flotillin family protein [Enterococcus thailandicus]MDT2733554.1 flotillin family protein [Enterococcus thailandicus]MDT2750449.1 flotillin family protein [Enterococcus thailandicus]MDT2775010.1 flotillin family protein [Enterococcus thailandicus]MDT2793506.1 flotillin family protein [Enterococcus thailandicus]
MVISGAFLSVAIVIFILLMLLIVFVSKYQTAKPDEALIISGSYLGKKNVHTDESNNKIKIVRGGGAFVLPVFQRSNRISLLSSKLDVSTPEVYTEQGVPVMCDGTSIIKIGSSVEEIATAAEQFLGKTTDELENEAREVLEGHLRSILGSMTVEEIYQNRDKFSQSVQEVASVDLAKMGLIIVSFTIKEVRDKNGYLDSLGKPRIAQVKRDAEIAEAEALKETRIKKAQAEKESQAAELQRQTEIAESVKEKELKLAIYKQEQDVAKAKADQAYNLESARAQQQVIEQEMQMKVVERQKQIELEEKEIIRREKQYDSEVKKKADADRYAKEQEAQAQKVKEVTEAEAERFRVEALAEAQASQTRLAGQAEAEAILAKGKAEAEAKQKIADAFKEYGEAAVLSMVIEMLPQLMREAAQPLGNIEKISVVDTGNGSGENGGANRVTGYATNLLASTQETLKATTGLDLKEIIENLSTKGTSSQVNLYEGDSKPANNDEV